MHDEEMIRQAAREVGLDENQAISFEAALRRLRGSKGGRAAAKSMTREERTERGRKAALARWKTRAA